MPELHTASSYTSTNTDAVTSRISVIVPTYNRSDMLIEALESVLAQTYKDFEVIVIDDGSTDETSEKMKPYLDRITYVRQLNSGVAAARNHGLRLSRGEFVCFLDSDDKWLPGKLAAQIAFAEGNPQFGLISTELLAFNQLGVIESRSKASMYEIEDGYVVEKLLFSNWIQTSTVMARRECFERVGGFDIHVGQFGEDWLMWMRIAAIYPIHFIPLAFVLYRVHPESLTSAPPERQYRSLMAILNRLACLRPLIRRQALINLARYRIAFNRGKQDLRSGRYRLASQKLRQALNLKIFSSRTQRFCLYSPSHGNGYVPITACSACSAALRRRCGESTERVVGQPV